MPARVRRVKHLCGLEVRAPSEFWDSLRRSWPRPCWKSVALIVRGICCRLSTISLRMVNNMNRMICVLFLCLIAAVSVADTPADFKAAIDAAARDFPAAIAAKNAPAVGAYYATDAIVLSPNAEMVNGREAIQSFWKGFIDAGMNVKLEPVQSEAEGNLGVEVGKYTILDPAGKTADQGKYLVVWKKEDGKWKLYRDIWNTNMPAPSEQK